MKKAPLVFEFSSPIGLADNTVQFFQQRERSIMLALHRVNIKLQSFKANPDSPEAANWNLWHDLHDRLIDRQHDNYSQFLGWHLKMHGWCAID